MRPILIKATLVSLACAALKWSSAVILAGYLGSRLDPANWFVFFASPVIVALPVATFLFWQGARLRETHLALATAHLNLAEAHKRLKERSRRDDMTGLLTRHAFRTALSGEGDAPTAGALLIVDADRFKQINDTFGHQAGDLALLEIAGAITGALRQSDLVARVGGEEFAVFLRGADPAEAEQVAERIRQNVANASFSPDEGIAVPLSVSIGGAMSGDGQSFARLFESADRRLYEAKNAGRNRTVMPPVAEALASTG